MLRAFSMGRLLVTVLTVLAGLGLWAYSDVNNALNYTEVAARVERVEMVCRLTGTPLEASTYCREVLFSVTKGKKVIRHNAVYVRYKSPADGKDYSGRVIPVGGDTAIEATKLEPGDQWTIMARDDRPQEIKPE